MTVKIDWKHTIPFNPTFGPNLGDVGKGGIKIPAYGKYGGPQISGPGEPVDKLDALFQTHDIAIGKIGKATGEQLVAPHADLINGIVGSEDGKFPGLPETKDGLLVVGDADHAPPVGDAEATLYSGMTIFALTAQLAQSKPPTLIQFENALDSSDPWTPSNPLDFDDISRALHDASRYMERGLEEVPGAGKGLHGALQLFEKGFADLLDTPDPLHSSGDSILIA
jgi:hypothetical protein